MEKFTFLLPAYKAIYFEDALNSIKNQSYKDFKVIVSDDCSPEPLKDIFNSIVGNDPRFVYRRNEINIGGKSLVEHWNLLVDLCETEFFMMASDDDIYESGYLTQINELVEKYPNVDLFRSRVRTITSEGNFIRQEYAFAEYMNHARFFRTIFLTEFLYCEAAYCYRKFGFVKRGKYVDTPLAWFTDQATHILMAENGCAFTKDVLFNFRISTSSISGTSNAKIMEQKVKATLQFWKWISEYKNRIIEDKFEIGIKNIALYDCKEDVKRNIQNLLIRCNMEVFFKYIPIAQKELDMSRSMLIYNWILVKFNNLKRIIKK